MVGLDTLPSFSFLPFSLLPSFPLSLLPSLPPSLPSSLSPSLPPSLLPSLPSPSLPQPSGKHVVYINDGGAGPTASGHAPTQGPPPMPKDYLGLALFGLVFCCFPLGVIALLRSLEVGVV